ncbi:hypothetical protein B0H14DRAFT_1413916 [Mycena olivaceomarginata]|nr:hypothetical protein B0H14DRAFT_1413916 [Mycena olivaceomarginata]
MVYACRMCPYDELVENQEQVGVTTDLGSDPTLAHSNIPCPQCGHEDAVLYQDQSKRKETRMILFYVCVKCNHSFTDPTLPSDSMRVDTAEDG